MTAFAIIALCVCVGLHVADVVTTNAILAKGGSETWFMKLAMRYLGEQWWLPKALLIAVATVGAWWGWGMYGLSAASSGLAVAGLVAVIYNVRQMNK